MLDTIHAMGCCSRQTYSRLECELDAKEERESGSGEPWKRSVAKSLVARIGSSDEPCIAPGRVAGCCCGRVGGMNAGNPGNSDDGAADAAHGCSGRNDDIDGCSCNGSGGGGGELAGGVAPMCAMRPAWNISMDGIREECARRSPVTCAKSSCTEGRRLTWLSFWICGAPGDSDSDSSTGPTGSAASAIAFAAALFLVTCPLLPGLRPDPGFLPWASVFPLPGFLPEPGFLPCASVLAMPAGGV